MKVGCWTDVHGLTTQKQNTDENKDTSRSHPGCHLSRDDGAGAFASADQMMSLRAGIWRPPRVPSAQTRAGISFASREATRSVRLQLHVGTRMAQGRKDT